LNVFYSRKNLNRDNNKRTPMKQAHLSTALSELDKIEGIDVKRIYSKPSTKKDIDDIEKDSSVKSHLEFLHFKLSKIFN
ncbi:MAG: hypothetical protein KGL19_00545, partial [Bacteroidota bacterium]|nr:hypothetical protein [Bacteroidota bacterium]